MYLHIITDLKDEEEVLRRFNEFRLSNVDYGIPSELRMLEGE